MDAHSSRNQCNIKEKQNKQQLSDNFTTKTSNLGSSIVHVKKAEEVFEEIFFLIFEK